MFNSLLFVVAFIEGIEETVEKRLKCIVAYGLMAI
jgi:hypothetical protein